MNPPLATEVSSQGHRQFASSPVPQRWICWPDPDRVCLEGGCIYCTPDPHSQSDRYIRSHFRKMTRDQVVAYTESNGYVIAAHMIDHGMQARAVDQDAP